MLLIKDTEVLEGFAGALGIYFTRIIISDYLLHKPYMLIGIAWFVSWYIRKITINYYINWKRLHKQRKMNELTTNQNRFNNN